MIRFILKITFFLLPISVFCQTIRLTGVVVDKETLAAISGVNIFMKDHKVGTISTAKGYFSLTVSAYKTDNYLYFSNIGYETDSIQISKITGFLSVQLTAKTYSLNEVYVMPDSTLFTLLKKAYNKISENYPNQPTRYEVFYQESAFQKDSLIELIEAVLTVYKESYLKKREMQGQIQIVKSRIKQLQSSRVGFIGGVFAPLNSDVVLKRENYISPAKMKYFKYDFLGIKNYSGRDCYEITFSPLNMGSANTQGSMLIDVETLAYVFFEINSEKKENAKTYIGIMNPTEKKIKVVYEQYKGKWYLKQVSSRSKYDNVRLNSRLYSSLDFITTYIQDDSVRPIPIEKRMEYLEPIEAKTEKYNPKGWTDSKITVNKNPEQLGFQFSTDEALFIYNQNIPKKKVSFAEAVIKIIPKLKLGYGISFDYSKQIIVNQSIIGYKFDKKWNIQWQVTENFFLKNIKYRENRLGVEFRKNMNNATYPLFLGTFLGVADNYFDSKSESFRTQMLIPQLSLSKRTNKFFTFEFFVNYPIIIRSNSFYQKNNYHLQIGINTFLF